MEEHDRDFGARRTQTWTLVGARDSAFGCFSADPPPDDAWLPRRLPRVVLDLLRPAPVELPDRRAAAAFARLTEELREWKRQDRTLRESVAQIRRAAMQHREFRSQVIALRNLLAHGR